MNIRVTSPGSTRFQPRPKGRRCRSMALVALAAFAAVAAAQTPPGAPAEGADFAVVNGRSIPQQRLERAIRSGVRARFYHGAIPSGEAVPFLTETVQAVIDEELLVQEARRRGVVADVEAIERRLAEVDRANSGKPGWTEARERMLVEGRELMTREQLRSRLEAQVRTVPPPDAGVLRAYHAAHPDKFTEPVRQRVSLILLGVDPASGAAAWQAARELAAELATRLKADPAQFAALAQQHSTDATAAAGGDMGYVHDGMLSPLAEAALAKLPPGAVSEPLQLLEGVAIFRLDERTAPRPVPFEAARERVLGLWEREQRETVWTGFLQQLRDSAAIEINDEVMASARDRLTGAKTLQ